MDIEGLGTEVIEALVSGGHVHSPVDLYTLTVDQLAALPLANGQLYGAIRAAKLVASIDASRAKPFSTVLHALGAPGVGYPECRTIAQHFSLAALLELSAANDGVLQAELTALHGIGPATATAVATYLAEQAAWVGQLPDVGLQVERESMPQAADGPLSGQTFVVTGSLEMGSREDVEAWIRAHGGTVSSSVSSHTTYLVAGVKPGGSKVKAAAKHGVAVLGEPELYALVEERPE
ncbi:MAG: ligase, NAD-dependent [Chloroflexi bacterium]|nr:ligase, NAD-dependent [Chloroflexota bacterium]